MKTLRRKLWVLWGGILDRLIPLHTKRLVYLATLYTYMKGDVEDEEATLQELNLALKLAMTSTEAIVIPSQMSRLIWKGNGKEAANWSDEETTRRLIRRCPCWLTYGRDDDLLRDINDLKQFIASKA